MGSRSQKRFASKGFRGQRSGPPQDQQFGIMADQWFGQLEANNGYLPNSGNNDYMQHGPQDWHQPFHSPHAEDEGWWSHSGHPGDWSYAGPFEQFGPYPAAAADPYPQQRPNFSVRHPPTNMERFELFKNLLMAREKHPTGKTYLAIYWLEFEGKEEAENSLEICSPLFENDHRNRLHPSLPIGNCHAEDHLLNHLKKQLSVVDRNRLKSITIMQNSSPCAVCAKGFQKELGTLQLLDQVQLIFSSLHWVRRCSNNNHHQQISHHKHEPNRDGLLKLRDAGVRIRSTCYEDWQKLLSALQLPRPPPMLTDEAYRASPRGREDDELKKDLDFLLSSDRPSTVDGPATSPPSSSHAE